MFWGLVVLSLPITIVGANFDEEYREMRKNEKDKKLREEAAEEEARQEEERRNSEAAEASEDPRGSSSSLGPDGTPGSGSAKRKTRSILRRGVKEARDADRPTVRIRKLVNESNDELARQVNRLMLKHERELRREIKKILVEHGEGCDQVTPLEVALDRLVDFDGPDAHSFEVQTASQGIAGVCDMLQKRSAGKASASSASSAASAASSSGAARRLVGFAGSAGAASASSAAGPSSAADAVSAADAASPADAVSPANDGMEVESMTDLPPAEQGGTQSSEGHAAG
jgi:hypothetical protein